MAKRKLNDRDIEEIREAWAEDLKRCQVHRAHSHEPYRGLSMGHLASRYDVSEPTIAHVINKTGAYRVPHKPCPFCGSTDLYIGHAHATAAQVMCRQCGARSCPVELSDDPYRDWATCIKLTLILWNHRAG